MEGLTLGQVRNAIDAMIQRGEFSPDLPAAALFPEYSSIHEHSKSNSQETPYERTS